ncbi:MAG: hypothetical protein R3B41_01335 [Candidatus Doudnabacteria bacterium]
MSIFDVFRGGPSQEDREFKANDSAESLESKKSEYPENHGDAYSDFDQETTRIKKLSPAQRVDALDKKVLAEKSIKYTELQGWMEKPQA